jgi:hypothetical protein
LQYQLRNITFRHQSLNINHCYAYGEFGDLTSTAVTIVTANMSESSTAIGTNELAPPATKVHAFTARQTNVRPNTPNTARSPLIAH